MSLRTPSAVSLSKGAEPGRLHSLRFGPVRPGSEDLGRLACTHVAHLDSTMHAQQNPYESQPTPPRSRSRS